MKSSSQYTTLYFYISKKDGSLQLIQDYRKLNQYMIKDKILQFLIRKVIDKLKETKYFNKLDLIQSYNNVQIKEENKQKVVFSTNQDLFKPKVMYFELYNSLGMFQRIINNIFQELLHEGVLANYINNSVILAKTKKELEEQTI